MKKILLFAMLIMSVFDMKAQWPTNGTAIYYLNGNVGIGTNSPIYGKLQVTQTTDASDQGIAVLNSTGTRAMRLWADANNSYVYSGATGIANLILNTSGFVGIGTTTPETKLHINNGVVKSGTQNSTGGSLQFAGNYVGNNILNTYGSQYSSGATSIGYAVKPKSGASGFVSSAENSSFARGILLIDNELEFLNAWSSTVAIDNDLNLTSRFYINGSGNVGIGTTNPQSLLSVKGKITAQEVEVTMTGWSDFVFQKNYKLISLEDLQKYIAENRHLPDVPSEQEVKEKGLNLGQNDAVLLQKIEELTLYLIEQNKTLKTQSETLKYQNKTLIKQSEVLKAQNEKIKVLEEKVELLNSKKKQLTHKDRNYE
jgi:hypothetical protein